MNQEADDKTQPEGQKPAVTKNPADDTALVPEEVQQFLKNLPADQQANFARFISSSFTHVGPFVSPIEKQITPEHITSIIAIQKDKELHDFTSGESTKRHNFKHFVTGAIFVCILLWILLTNSAKELIVPLLTGGIGLGGGYGWGYGAGRRKK